MILHRNLLHDHLPQSAHVADVGAHKGEILEEDFTHLSTTGVVHYSLFEPQPLNLQYIKARALEESITSFVIYPVAATNATGPWKFLQPRFLNASNEARLLIDDLSATLTDLAYVTEIRGRRLDETLSLTGKVDLLRIHVKGFEPLVLYGAEFILHNVELIIFGCSRFQRAARGGPGATMHDTQAFLSKFGFHTFKVGKHYMLNITGSLYSKVYDEFIGRDTCFAIRPRHPIYDQLQASYKNTIGCRAHTESIETPKPLKSQPVNTTAVYYSDKLCSHLEHIFGGAKCSNVK